MSSQNMGRASKDRGNKTQNTTHNTKNMTAEWPKAPDGLNPKVQATAEQIRIAQIINDANKSDDPDLQNKIDQIVELTGKSNDTAIIALHDCDNDADRAVNMLLEGTQNEGEWELSGKKKKNRQSQKQTEVTPDGGKGSTSTSNNKENRAEKSERTRGDRGDRNRGGDRGDRGDRGEGKSGRDDFRNRGPPRLNRGRGGNWRNKENEKNERNLEESRRERNAEGKDEGRPRGGRRGRGNRGGDRGDRGNREGGGGRVRTFQNRGLSSDGFPQSMDTWTNSTAEQASDNSGRTKGANHSVGGTGNWSEIANSEDWSEEDWNESLTETKVFTPSTSVHSSIQKNDENVPSQLSQSLDLVSLLQGPVSDLSATKNSIQANGATQLPPSQVSQVPSHQHSAISQGSASQLGQNQFSLSPYAQQAAESIKAAVGIPSGMSTTVSHHPSNTNNTPYSSVFSASSHNQQQVAQQALSLDLQSQGSNAATTLQHMQQQANAVAMAKNNQALSQRPKPQRPRIPPPSKIPESAVEMPDDGIAALDVQFGALEFGTDSSPFDFTGLSDSVASFQDSVSTNMLNSQLPVGHANNAPITSSIPITLTSTLSKDSSSGYGLNSSVQTSHISKDLSQNASSSITGPSQKQVSAPDTMMMSSQSERKNVPGPTYGSQRTSQSTAVDGPYSGQKSSLLGSTGLNSNSNNYSHQSSSLTPMDNMSNVNNQSQSSYMSNTHNSSGGTYGMQSSTAYSGSAQTTGSYQPQSGYTTSYTYPTQQGYTNNANHSLSNSSSKLNSSLNHVDPQQNSSQLSYDSSSAGNLSTTMVSAANNSVGGLGGTNLGGSSSLGGLVAATSSSTITTSVLKNSVPATGKPQPNIPPGVPAAAAATPTMMSHHPYIMSQAAGLPFYGLQPTIYNIEDMQMMQSRLGYYDMQYSAPTSLTGRDPSMASVAYTDVKFSRTDSDASSVATTLSQGQNATQTHGQTFLNAAPALHPGYGYYFPGGMMPGSIPHYAPPLFQVPPATNAHGASSNTQYQKATAYGSHSYGSGTGTTPDLSNSIYSKSHQPLAKAAGPIGNSSTPYAPTPFIPLLAHGQPHSINLHHHLQDSPQSGAGAHSGGPQRSQQTMGQPKGPASGKQSYPFWNSN